MHELVGDSGGICPQCGTTVPGWDNDETRAGRLGNRVDEVSLVRLHPSRRGGRADRAHRRAHELPSLLTLDAV